MHLLIDFVMSFGNDAVNWYIFHQIHFNLSSTFWLIECLPRSFIQSHYRFEIEMKIQSNGSAAPSFTISNIIIGETLIR